MLIDLNEFSEENFDSKAWVNSISSSIPQEDSMDKYLSEIEMKLQLLFEDIATGMEELSSSSLLRIPRAVREINRVKDDSLLLRNTVGGILQRLLESESASAQSVASLSKLDVVKNRMESARNILEDAAGLAQLTASIEEVFNHGDLQKVAETLANMKRCLAAVGKVPEFADMEIQLASYEDRLEGMVQPQLSDALSSNKVEVSRNLRDILIAIGKYDGLETIYNRVRIRPLKKAWEDFDSSQPSISMAENAFSEWLPQFYDEVLILIKQESDWSTSAFPSESPLLLPKLLISFFETIHSSFLSRLEKDVLVKNFNDEINALSMSTIPSNSTINLHLLISLHSLTTVFVKNVFHLLLNLNVEKKNMNMVMKSIYDMFESYVQNYAEIEKKQLTNQISSLVWTKPGRHVLNFRGSEMSDCIRKMESSIPEVMSLMEAAMERCFAFTGGSETEALLSVLDDILLTYLSRLFQTISLLQTYCGIETNSKSKPSSQNGQPSKVNPSELTELATSSTPAPKNASAVNDDVFDDDDDESDEAEDASGLDWSEPSGEDGDWLKVQNALMLLNVIESLKNRFAALEACVRGVMGRISVKLSPLLPLPSRDFDLDADVALSASGGPKGESSFLSLSAPHAPDAALLRLEGAQEKAQRLASLLSQIQDPRFRALSRSSQKTQSLADVVNDFVYEMLIMRVRSRLADVATLPAWSEEEEDNAFDLPNFSSSPLPYITDIGEYLIILPQQLQPLSSKFSSAMAAAPGGEEAEGGEEGEGEGDFFAAEWVLKVVEGAMDLYIRHLRAIPHLTPRGVEQLSVDIEYIGNVLSSLFIPTPQVLSTFMVSLTTPAVGFLGLLSEDYLDIPTVKLVAKMRKISLETA